MYKRFEDLKVWQLAREFRKNIYNISKMFPKEEIYGLTNQIRRAAYSITANIAEGHGRYHYQENIQFCRTSRASINEVLDYLYTALDNNYITEKDFHKLYDRGRKIEMVLNGYIEFLQKKLEL